VSDHEERTLPVQDQAWRAEQFERHRPQLTAVAYRILGSAAEAEDAVQEAWLRLSKSDGEAIANYGGWLTTVTGRVCLDMLRSRRSRREFYLSSWEPEVTGGGPEQETVLADSVGWALMVVLDTLNPAERVAFVLHDLFAVPFEEIAPQVGPGRRARGWHPPGSPERRTWPGTL
jgi:RNA polymerase sigma-70 factor (ECF subfamily)